MLTDEEKEAARLRQEASTNRLLMPTAARKLKMRSFLSTERLPEVQQPKEMNKQPSKAVISEARGYGTSRLGMTERGANLGINEARR